MNPAKTLKIAVIGGDGTGPEVAAEGLKVLAAVAQLEGFRYELAHYDFGGDRYLRTGEILPRGPSTSCARSTRFTWVPSAIRTSAGILEKGLAARAPLPVRSVHQSSAGANCSPASTRRCKDKGPADIDFVVVRENTEDLYCGVGGFLKKRNGRRGRQPDRRLYAQGLRTLHPLGL